VIEIEIKKCC